MNINTFVYNTVNSNVFPVNQTRWTIFILFTVCGCAMWSLFVVVFVVDERLFFMWHICQIWIDSLVHSFCLLSNDRKHQKKNQQRENKKSKYNLLNAILFLSLSWFYWSINVVSCCWVSLNCYLPLGLPDIPVMYVFIRWWLLYFML